MINNILTGFFFGVGAICAWVLFQLILFALKELYIRYFIKKYYSKRQEPKKPDGMEFGKFKD